MSEIININRPYHRNYLATAIANGIEVEWAEMEQWQVHIQRVPTSFAEDFVKNPENGQRYCREWLGRVRRLAA